MVHKQYIKKNGKLIGPYYYESYREDGKVKKRYFGKKLPIGMRLSVLKSLFFAFVFAFVIISLGFLVIGAGSDSTRNDEWTMFGRYLNHSGYINVSAPSNISKADISTTGGATIKSIPTIVNGYIYFGSTDNYF